MVDETALKELKELMLRIETSQRLIREGDFVVINEQLDRMNRHLKELNGAVLKNTIRSVQNETTNAGQGALFKIITWAVGVEFLMLAAILTVSLALLL